MKIAVLFGYGINCQDETVHACELASNGSAIIEKIHINEFLTKEKNLKDYSFLIFPGGFSGGDQLGAGVFYALKVEKLRDELENFIKDGKLILGICNGFQVLTNLGLLPGIKDYKAKTVDLTYNDCGNFQDRWVNLKINRKSPCIFTKGIDNIELPIRHGEGKLWATQETLDELKETYQIVMQYSNSDGSLACGKFPQNPNNSLDDVAGICDKTGRIFGLMPHPEAYNHWTNHPQWTRLKEKLRKENKRPPQLGAGIKIFENAINYIKENKL